MIEYSVRLISVHSETEASLKDGTLGQVPSLGAIYFGGLGVQSRWATSIDPPNISRQGEQTRIGFACLKFRDLRVKLVTLVPYSIVIVQKTLSVPVFLVDPTGRLLFYNEPAEAILGRWFEETGVMPAD